MRSTHCSMSRQCRRMGTRAGAWDGIVHLCLSLLSDSARLVQKFHTALPAQHSPRVRLFGLVQARLANIIVVYVSEWLRGTLQIASVHSQPPHPPACS
jgi:hypothetical protein